ncbi:hypothetical protein ATANTOWER_019465 [Ataeniobius toweri]|uniref:Uncharacterized protein n=1 Tax=Ataeniobius toweri TaxID=208326 RepID=A0ABU7CHM2_9TELE|nr:hypothetical protein [Ataeniobius toweri]
MSNYIDNNEVSNKDSSGRVSIKTVCYRSMRKHDKPHQGLPHVFEILSDNYHSASPTDIHAPPRVSLNGDKLRAEQRGGPALVQLASSLLPSTVRLSPALPTGRLNIQKRPINGIPLPAMSSVATTRRQENVYDLTLRLN